MNDARNLFWKIFFLGCFLITELSGEEESQKPPLPTLSESEYVHFQMLVDGNNRFGFDLYQHMKNQPGNLFYSPYSIVTGLGMVSIGAKGETARQFQHAFRYTLPLLLFIGDLNESLQKGSYSKEVAQVLLANALWVDKSIKVLPSFTQTFLRDFRDPLQQVDFRDNLSATIQQINQWVLKQTKGKINHMLLAQDVPANAKMILTTAAYVKGKWGSPFDRALTKRLPFQITSQRTLLTEMMHQTSHYSIFKGEQWDILAIPFEQGEEGAQLAMVILLPKKDISISLLEKNLTWDNWKQWKGQLHREWVSLGLPSFRIDKRLDLDTLLKGIGFTAVYNSEANFSGMTGEKDVYLNAVIHKTSIKIDEKGADISTVNSKSQTSIAEEKAPYLFIADRPFVFMIWDQKTDSILFMGRLAMP